MSADRHTDKAQHDPHDPPHEHIARLADATVLLAHTLAELQVPVPREVAPCDSILPASISSDSS